METLQLNDFLDYLKPRPQDSHKGDFGRVLVVGGDFGYSGAVHLAAEAALRVGAGLVTVGTRPEFAMVLNVARPEIMCRGLDSAKDLTGLLDNATVVVIGPGLGKEGWGHDLLKAVLESDKPLLVDADGLNILAEKKKPLKKSNWILTPHPGEAARLLKISTQEVQQDRIGAVKKLHDMFGGVIVLKGAGTLVMTSDSGPSLCEAGNPGMATAGMGDVLSGVIGGLAAQQIPLAEATKIGVLIHAIAGDIAAEEGARGMIASDLMPYLRRLASGFGEI